MASWLPLCPALGIALLVGGCGQSWGKFWQAPILSNVLPATNDFIGGPVVSYTLSENCKSGRIIWTRTGGTADSESPRTQTMTGSELTQGEHKNIALTNQVSLVNGAVYSASFEVNLSTEYPTDTVTAANVTHGSTTPRRVYCQTGFSGVSTTGTSATLCNNMRRAMATKDGVYLADSTNYRALFFPGTSTTATRVYGQSNNLGTGGVLQGGITTGFQNPQSVFADDSGVFVSDYDYHRVIFFPGTSTTASATRVYGQANLSGNSTSCTATGLNSPVGVVSDASGIYIADRNNNRVLFYPGTSTTATRVYGQPDLTTCTAGTTATKMSAPNGVALSADGIYVSEENNHRVLFFPGTSTTPTRVYGQPNFTSGILNQGAGAANPSANTLNIPNGVFADAAGVYIADFDNDRVLYYLGTSTTATRVYGQNGIFTTALQNLGNGTTASINSLWGPHGIWVDAQNIYVSDNGNNRILVY